MTRALSVPVLIRPLWFSLFFYPSSSSYLNPRLQDPFGPLMDLVVFLIVRVFIRLFSLT